MTTPEERGRDFMRRLDETIAQAPADAREEIPIFRESMAGSLIDSARISVMAALAFLPPLEKSLIIVPGEGDDELDLADEAAETAQGCLGQAMEWLDAARMYTIAAGAPVTSLHVAGGGTPP